MSVCTASLFQWNSGTNDAPDYGPAFVIAADRMMTDHELGIEYEASRLKATPIRSDHMIFVAGDFTFLSEALAILQEFLPDAERMATSEIAEGLSKAFIHVRNLRLEKRYLAPLGPVDEVPDPYSGGGDEDEADVAVGGLVVSGGQSAAVLEL